MAQLPMQQEITEEIIKMGSAMQQNTEAVNKIVHWIQQQESKQESQRRAEQAPEDEDDDKFDFLSDGKFSPDSRTGVELAVLADDPAPLPKIQELVKRVTPALGVPEAAKTRNNMELYQAQIKLQAAMSLVIEGADTTMSERATLEHQKKIMVLMRSAWQDITEARRKAELPKGAEHVLNDRPDKEKASLYSSEELKKIDAVKRQLKQRQRGRSRSRSRSRSRGRYPRPHNQRNDQKGQPQQQQDERRKNGKPTFRKQSS
eukprot:TRINITY_DN2499_c1_g1_i2.p3 TRINITY_DN2499_c1_g1~~TRINITY_DN2499_c1_g1_i2.p3  ORF type:complete len:260 (+),score=54.67 TRINITY_DN2499_c1_g1_i2:88-867(+)